MATAISISSRPKWPSGVRKRPHQTTRTPRRSFCTATERGAFVSPRWRLDTASRDAPRRSGWRWRSRYSEQALQLGRAPDRCVAQQRHGTAASLTRRIGAGYVGLLSERPRPNESGPRVSLRFRRRRSGRFRLRGGRLGTGEIAGLDDHDLRQVDVLLQSGLYLRRRQCGDLRFEVAVPLHRPLEEEILRQT